MCINSGGSRPSDKGWWGGGGGSHSDPEIKWGGAGLKKMFFGTSGLSLVER